MNTEISSNFMNNDYQDRVATIDGCGGSLKFRVSFHFYSKVIISIDRVLQPRISNWKENKDQWT